MDSIIVQEDNFHEVIDWLVEHVEEFTVRFGQIVVEGHILVDGDILESNDSVVRLNGRTIL